MQAASVVTPTPAAALTSTDASQTPSGAQPTAKPAPGLNELEDVLFDLLASGGIEPSLSHDKLDVIQTFLHEHARERKTHEQFVAFFEQHALPMQPVRPNLLALPVVDARSRSARAPLLIDPAPDTAPLMAAQSLAPAALETFAPAAVSGKPASRSSGWLWALGFGAIAGLMALGIGAVIELRSELQQLRAEATHGALELEQLRTEVGRLRAQVQETGHAVTRTEHKAQLLMQTVASPLVDPSRFENSR